MLTPVLQSRKGNNYTTIQDKRDLANRNEPWHEISNNVVCATSKASDRPAHTRSLIRTFACRLNILWLLGYWLVSKLKRRLHRLVWVCTCQNATLLEITCRGSNLTHIFCYKRSIISLLTLGFLCFFFLHLVYVALRVWSVMIGENKG